MGILSAGVTTTATRKLAPGEHHVSDHGHLKVRLDRHHDGVAITVMCGPDRNGDLSRGFPNDRLATARAWYTALIEAADSGLQVWQIVARLQVLDAAGHALTSA